MYTPSLHKLLINNIAHIQLLQTGIIYLSAVAGKKKSLFSNPDKFDPDRWARDKSQSHPFSVLTFGFGARGCYGELIYVKYIPDGIAILIINA